MPCKGGFTSIDGAPAPFDNSFDSYQLASEIEKFLGRDKGFTVILEYPDSKETYSGTSKADTWQQAALEVAARMFKDNDCNEDGVELSICDVLEGVSGHHTCEGADRYDIKIFDAGVPRFVDPYAPEEDAPTYTIYRFFGPELGTPRKLMAEGLTLEEAQEHCEDPDSQGEGYFDGYEKE